MPSQTERTNEERLEINRNHEEAESHEQSDGKKRGAPLDSAKRRRGILIGAVAGISLIAICVFWWLHSATYESTDDAQVDGHLNPIAARVGGTVKAVYVEDNQPVQAGAPLVDLDTKDSEVQLAVAKANYDQALAQLNAESPNVEITQTSNASDIATSTSEVINADAALSAAQRDYDSYVAKLRQAEATNGKSQTDLARYKQLVERQEVAQSDYDQYLATARSQEANMNSAAAAVASAQKMIEQRQAQLQQQKTKRNQTLSNAPRQIAIRRANTDSRRASVESYKAQLDQAILNLSYCHITAPVSGIVMQRSAELGGRISAGQQLIMIAQISETWVTANFKETQVRKMHTGQKVSVKVDALSQSFEGTVENMPAATGDRASVLPAENATGNYVKVIQRLPVRIRLKPGQQDLDKLRPGMSVEPTVQLE